MPKLQSYYILFMDTSNNLYQAIWGFQGETTGDLVFEAGDIITVVAKTEPEWWDVSICKLNKKLKSSVT